MIINHNRDLITTMKFSRLLYYSQYEYRYIMEFEVNGKIKLWYNSIKISGFIDEIEKENEFLSINKDKSELLNYNLQNHINLIRNSEISNCCILQDQTDLNFLFSNTPITHFDKDLPNVENTEYMFSGCKDLIYFNSKMPKVENIKGMFYGCSEEFFQKYPHLRDL